MDFPNNKVNITIVTIRNYGVINYDKPETSFPETAHAGGCHLIWHVFRCRKPDLSGPFRPAGRSEPDSCHSRLYSYCSWHSDPWRCRHREYAFRRSAGSCFPWRKTIRLFFHLPALLDHWPLLCHSAMCHNLLYHRDCPDAWRRLRRTHDTVSLFRSVLQSCALLLPASGQHYTLDWKNHQSDVLVFPGNPDRICPAASGRTGFLHTPGCVVSERCPVPRPL